MSKWLIGALALVAAGGAQAAAIEDTGPIPSTGDGILYGLPILAFSLTFLLHDDSRATSPSANGANSTGATGGSGWLHMTGGPRHDFGLALLRTEVITFGLKGLVTEERPNGEPHSFPSAHSSTTFMAAEFVRKEYGWGWGAPAYLAAGFAGYSRIEAHEHWWQDVAAGATIGILSNHDFGEIRGWRIEPGLLGFRKPSSTAEPDATGVAPGVRLETRF